MVFLGCDGNGNLAIRNGNGATNVNASLFCNNITTLGSATITGATTLIGGATTTGTIKCNIIDFDSVNARGSVRIGSVAGSNLYVDRVIASSGVFTVFQQTYPWPKAGIDCASLKIGNTTITEDHLKMLTGAKPIQLLGSDKNANQRLGLYGHNSGGCKVGVYSENGAARNETVTGCGGGDTYFKISQ
jgi:hypothetical protein